MSDELMKPYPNEHSCRMRDPGDFQPDSFRRIKQGKLHMIIGRLKGESSTTVQAYRYPKEDWDADEARSHCSKEGGRFEAAAKTLSREQIALIDETISQIDAVHIRKQSNILEAIKQKIRTILEGL